MLNRIFYESRISGRFGPLALLALQKSATRRNLEAEITSFLFYDKCRIFQILEGETKSVEKTMARIVGNRLHKDVKIRANMRCDARNFSHWPFGATHIDDPDFRRVINASQQSEFFALDVLQAERALGIIASRKRRAVKLDEYAMKVRNFDGEEKPRRLFAALNHKRNNMPVAAGQIFIPSDEKQQVVAG
jgi:hypothetical protein